MGKYLLKVNKIDTRKTSDIVLVLTWRKYLSSGITLMDVFKVWSRDTKTTSTGFCYNLFLTNFQHILDHRNLEFLWSVIKIFSSICKQARLFPFEWIHWKYFLFWKQLSGKTVELRLWSTRHKSICSVFIKFNTDLHQLLKSKNKRYLE